MAAARGLGLRRCHRRVIVKPQMAAHIAKWYGPGVLDAIDVSGDTGGRAGIDVPTQGSDERLFTSRF